jgi:hypothetical protein
MNTPANEENDSKIAKNKLGEHIGQLIHAARVKAVEKELQG